MVSVQASTLTPRALLNVLADADLQVLEVVGPTGVFSRWWSFAAVLKHADKRFAIDGLVCCPFISKGPTVFLNRGTGKEQQCRKLCKKCGLLVAYVCEPETDKIYLVDGAVWPEGARPDASSLGRSDAALSELPAAAGAGAGAGAATKVGAMDAAGEVSLTEDGSVPLGATGTVMTSAQAEDLEIEKRELSVRMLLLHCPGFGGLLTFRLFCCVLF